NGITIHLAKRHQPHPFDFAHFFDMIPAATAETNHRETNITIGAEGVGAGRCSRAEPWPKADRCSGKDGSFEELASIQFIHSQWLLEVEFRYSRYFSATRPCRSSPSWS